MPLTEKHIRILEVINAGHISGETLSQTLGISMPALRYYLDTLSQDGYLKAAKVYDNAAGEFRIVRAYLTEKGHAALAELKHPIPGSRLSVEPTSTTTESNFTDFSLDPEEAVLSIDLELDLEADLELDLGAGVAATEDTPAWNAAAQDLEFGLETALGRDKTLRSVPPASQFGQFQGSQPHRSGQLSSQSSPQSSPQPTSPQPTAPRVSAGASTVAAPTAALSLELPNAQATTPEWHKVIHSIDLLTQIVQELPSDRREVVDVYVQDLADEIKIVYRRKPNRIKAYFLAVLGTSLPALAQTNRANSFVEHARSLSEYLDIPVKLPESKA